MFTCPYYSIEQLLDDDDIIIVDREDRRRCQGASTAVDSLILTDLLFRFSRVLFFCVNRLPTTNDDDDMLLQYHHVVYSSIRRKYYYYYLRRISKISNILASVRNFIQ